MVEFHAPEKCNQTIIDEFLSGFTEEDKAKLSKDVFDLNASDFKMLGYVVFYADAQQFLTKNDNPNDLEFNEFQEWAQEFETTEAAITIAKKITDFHDDVEIQVCKHISNGTVSLFNAVWSNKPFNETE